MLLLMNSAMMPSDGTYRRESITKREFKKLFELNKNSYKCYIGYPNACQHASKLLGVELVLNRDETDFKAGDIALVIKLKYRVNPDGKSKNVQYKEEDYEFIKVTKIE